MDDNLSVMDSFKQDTEYFNAHYWEILGRHPDEWVAVLDERVVGSGDDVFELIDRLRSQGIPTERLVIRRAEAEPKVWILAVS